jgi:hypothetical protein
LKHDTARPLIEAQRVSKAVFKGLFDTAYATTHRHIALTSEEHLAADEEVILRFNLGASIRGWQVRLEQIGPVLPDLLYSWDGQDFRPALSGASYAIERWRKRGLEPRPHITLRLHHESAKVNGELVPAKQGPVISKAVQDGLGWALEYRPVGGLRLVVPPGITLEAASMRGFKRGDWLSDCFKFLWEQGEALTGAALWATGSPRSPYAEQSAYQRIFRHEAGLAWDQRLRKRVLWQRLIETYDEQAEEAEKKRPFKIAGLVAVWKWALARQHIEELPQRSKMVWSDDDEASPRSYLRPYRPGFWNLRDYTQLHRLKLKNGFYELCFRQKAASPVRYIVVTPELNVFYLRLWRTLLPSATQRCLEQIIGRRLYKIECGINFNSPYASGPFGDPGDGNEKFARCRSGTGSPIGLRKQSNNLCKREPWKYVRGTPHIGSWIIHPEGSAIRHARLKADMAAYNEDHPSYLNASNIGKTMRSRRSLNLPETISAVEATIHRHRSNSLPELIEDARLSQTMDSTRIHNGFSSDARRSVSVAR